MKIAAEMIQTFSNLLHPLSIDEDVFNVLIQETPWLKLLGEYFC